MQKLAENLWLLTYPLKILGADIIRNVTVIRHDSGKLLIHTTAPFTASDIEAIHQLGEPAWLVEAMLDHDTFGNEGHAAFPDVPYFAPPGFEKRVTCPVESLANPPSEWLSEIAVTVIEGNPSFGEHVFFHRPSRTLIVADLIFNYRKAPSLWTKLLLFLLILPTITMMMMTMMRALVDVVVVIVMTRLIVMTTTPTMRMVITTTWAVMDLT